MRSCRTPVVLLLAATTVGAARGILNAGDPLGLTVHEWGTFTSIAGQDGRPVEWLPLAGPIDLPCFVERIGDGIKVSLSGTVRMETPVIYFYAAREATVSVKVRFPQGTFTEWFPRAVVTRSNTIAWSDVKISPRAPADFPLERGANHYYVARQTDASPLQVGEQKEKFLFYRGVGRFAPPIAATVSADGTISVKSIDGGAVGDVMLFENRRGAIDFQAHRVASAVALRALAGKPDRLKLNPSATEAESPSPAAQLEKMLVARGLYPKEASAMVQTWRDSWFEQGTRLFYVVSRGTVDSILPLEIQPQPADVTRVFVGRMELVTAATKREVKDAIVGNDTATLAQYARFLRPIVDGILADSDSAPVERARLERGLTTYAASIRPASACN
jgi:hypothetical protein